MDVFLIIDSWETGIDLGGGPFGIALMP